MEKNDKQDGHIQHKHVRLNGKSIHNKTQAKNNIHTIANFIRTIQLGDGAIPWFKDHTLDPWDHCEAIMALSLAEDYRSALNGLDWLKENQNHDGSWYARYLGDIGDNDKDRKKIETNFVAYPATALWHLYLCNRSSDVLLQFFPMLDRAIDFVISQQHAEGDIQWAISKTETLANDALITACSSILRSLECAISIANTLKIDKPIWSIAHNQLADALKNKPWRFDRTWESKARFSMDWFYPVLSGVYTQTEAALRIEQSYDKFIVPALGCKCVADEPWITVAESCEFIMALVAAGRRDDAEYFLNLLQRWQVDDGGYWTGFVYKDNCIWPEEKTAWTAAAMALACDAVFQLSPAHRLFTQSSGLLVI